MKQNDDLIKAYIASDMNSAIVTAWYAQNSPSGDTLSALAENIGTAFLGGNISFNVANGLLNQLMPLTGFECAPRRVWQYYIAFEESEASNDPDTHVRPAVIALTIAGSP